MEQSTPNIKALRLYLAYWRHFWRYTAISALFSLLLALQRTIVPLLIALILGQFLREDTINVGLLIGVAFFQLMVLAVSYICDKYGVAILHDKVSEKLYDDSYRYLIRQDYSFYADRFSGSIVTQASRFSKSYTIFNDVVFFELLPQVFSVIIAVIIMSYFSPWLALAVFVLWLFAIYVVGRFAMQRLPLRRGAIMKESEQVGELADMITNALTVKTFASEDREIKRYDAINRTRGALFLRSWRRAVRNAWIVETICVVLQMVVLVSAFYLLNHGTIGIATFLLFQLYALRVIENISRSVFIARQLEVVSGDAQEMTEMMEQAPLVQDAPFALSPKLSNGAIEFNNVQFQYQDVTSKQEPLLDNFSLAIKPGEKIGLVGPSGGGKTTITRLLLRFMDIQNGAITIDGHEIRGITQHSLREAIAYVPQEPLLFHRSIKDNIRYGKPNATDAEVIEAAKKSYAHEFVSSLPEGYDTLVGERGVKLSGGQRQRVAIARAMLKNAPILVLDEATSALDSESEQLIQKALWELMKGRTAVVIAHRLSTINHMDRIVVLDKGKIIEQGSHRTLLKHKGLYAKLWSHQSGGFLE